MKIQSSVAMAAILGLSMVSSYAYSGDILRHTCKSCHQIPIPAIICSTADATSEYCGSEDWLHGNVQECKKFSKITQYCVLGGLQIFTVTSWTGAGSYCESGDDPMCKE